MLAGIQPLASSNVRASFGATSFGATSFGATSFGATSFGVASFGATSFGASASLEAGASFLRRHMHALTILCTVLCLSFPHTIKAEPSPSAPPAQAATFAEFNVGDFLEETRQGVRALDIEMLDALEEIPWPDVIDLKSRPKEALLKQNRENLVMLRKIIEETRAKMQLFLEMRMIELEALPMSSERRVAVRETFARFTEEAIVLIDDSLALQEVIGAKVAAIFNFMLTRASPFTVRGGSLKFKKKSDQDLFKRYEEAIRHYERQAKWMLGIP